MKRILVVDDNMLMRKLIINLFRKEEFTIDEAADGEEGLSKMSDIRYDLVITDLVMPGMEGIEMIRQAKERFPDVKIIAMTGSKPFYLMLAKKMGIQGILTKPLERNKFLTVVNSNL